MRDLSVAINVGQRPGSRSGQPCDDLIYGCVEYQYVHLQYYRKGGDIEGNHGKKNEERIRQKFVHGQELSLGIRNEETAELYPQCLSGIAL